MSAPDDTSPVTAYEPNCSMKRELGEGFRIADFITEEKIEACATLLQQATDDFFANAEADLKQLETLMASSNAGIEALPFQTHVYNIKALAKVLGFSLITEICVHSLTAITSSDLPEPKKQALLRKLVEALRLAFSERIRDDGGATGMELLTNLRKYITA